MKRVPETIDTKEDNTSNKNIEKASVQETQSNIGKKAIDSVGFSSHRVFFVREGKPISPFHDIPLWVDKEKGMANMIVEIPRGSRAKLEISRDEPLNPIKQDIKNGKLRYTHWPYPFNYGAFPQTWENPTHKDENTEAFGDNDPVDVVEIGKKVHKTGDVVVVKILGAYAMIDEGQTDWKVLAIDITDEDAEKYNSGDDVPEEKKKEVFEFLRDYKIPDGKPPNKFAFNGELKDKKFTMDTVEETFVHWKKLITSEIPATTDQYKITTIATELPPEECPSVVPKEKAAELLDEKLKVSRRLNKQVLSARVSNWRGMYWYDSDEEDNGGEKKEKKKARREED